MNTNNDKTRGSGKLDLRDHPLIQFPDEPKTRAKRKKPTGRPLSNPKGGKRIRILISLDKQTLLKMDLCRTFAKTRKAVGSRSGFIESIIWQQPSPGYDKLLENKPKL